MWARGAAWQSTSSKKSFPFCLTDRLSLISLILPKSTGQPAAKWTCCCWNFTLSNSVRIEWMAILFPGRSRVNPPTSMKHLMGTQRQGRPTRYKGQSSCDSSYSFWVTHRELGRAQISPASGVALPFLWVLYLPGPRKVCTVWCKIIKQEGQQPRTKIPRYWGGVGTLLKNLPRKQTHDCVSKKRSVSVFLEPNMSGYTHCGVVCTLNYTLACTYIYSLYTW